MLPKRGRKGNRKKMVKPRWPKESFLSPTLAKPLGERELGVKLKTLLVKKKGLINSLEWPWEGKIPNCPPSPK